MIRSVIVNISWNIVRHFQFQADILLLHLWIDEPVAIIDHSGQRNDKQQPGCQFTGKVFPCLYFQLVKGEQGGNSYAVCYRSRKSACSQYEEVFQSLVCFQDIEHIVFDFVEFIDKHNKGAYKQDGECDDEIFAQFFQYIHIVRGFNGLVRNSVSCCIDLVINSIIRFYNRKRHDSIFGIK